MPCDECNHWNKDERRRAKGAFFGECRRASQWWDATEWTEDEDPEEPWQEMRKLKPEFKDVKMFVQDGSDYMATLYTAPDFHCAHFEQR